MKRYFLFFILAIFVLSGCGAGQAEKGRKPMADWSRGLPIGFSVEGTADFLTTNNTLHFVWPIAIEDGTTIHYELRDLQGDMVTAVDLQLPAGRVRSSRLLQAESGDIHLFWSHRMAGSREWQLWYALLNEQGEFVRQPTALTDDNYNVLNFTVVQSSVGEGAILWEDDRGDDIYLQQVTVAGAVAPARLLVEDGIGASFVLGEEETVHLAWRDDVNNIYYDTTTLVETGTVEGVRVTDFTAAPTARISGPEIGVTADFIYLFWGIFSQTGEESGGRTEYVAFPTDNPTFTPWKRLWIMPMEDQPYEAYEGNYPLTEMVPAPESPRVISNYVYAPDAAASQGSEVALAISASQQYRLETYEQMVVGVFDNGRFEGYQLAGKTENFSDDGTLESDEQGNLHLVWREGAGGRTLYYATTAPDIRANIDRLDGGDVVNAMLKGGFEALTSILFFPFAFGWLLPGVLIIGAWRMRQEERLTITLMDIVILGVSVAVYQFVKFLFLPTAFSYVPFSAWLDLGQSWWLPLRIGTPITIFAIGVLVTAWRQRRAQLSILSYFMIACGVDAILTLAIYGVNFLGVF